MPYSPAKRPAFDPAANPTKLKCAAGEVFGWVYPDGTVELICRDRRCRRPGNETRHLFNPRTGVHVDLFVPKPAIDSSGVAQTSSADSPRRPSRLTARG